MLYALDLFSGIAGNSLGLTDYVRTVAYCEADRHAQAVLLSRMADGSIPAAPICTDVARLDGYAFRGKVDIIIAGFPCQDISVAGKGAGLEGERSGLFFEIVRLAKEIQPTFLFLENVPAIRTRGLDRVIQELTEAGYDCRWTMLSAANVGAPHKRERWFLLAHTKDSGGKRELREISSSNGEIRQSEEQENLRNESYDAGQQSSSLANTDSQRLEVGQCQPSDHGTEQPASKRSRQILANALHNGQLTAEVGFGSWPCNERDSTGTYRSTVTERRPKIVRSRNAFTTQNTANWWAVEPNVGRVVNGVPQRVDRIKRLGNAVVPEQARKAFEILIGLEE